jgi:hypothetical protein
MTGPDRGRARSWRRGLDYWGGGEIDLPSSVERVSITEGITSDSSAAGGSATPSGPPPSAALRAAARQSPTPPSPASDRPFWPGLGAFSNTDEAVGGE